MDNGTPRSGTLDENTPLLGQRKHNSNLSIRFRKHMTSNVSKHRADVVLLFGYLITGLIDSSAVYIWGAFASMQTGNTIYLGLGIVEPQASTRWLKSITSIASFCLGSLFFSTTHRLLGPRKRITLLLSFTLQLLLLILAALILTLTTAPPKDSNEIPWNVVVPLAAISFQSSGQAVTSRVLQYSGLTSVVLTSNYCDLFSDPRLFTTGFRENVERNRRIAAPVLLLIGAVGGGLFAHSSVGMKGALWVAAGLKAGVIGAWVLWPAERKEEEE
ncbi:uncharacterized protein BDZ99DRAFT_460806 [Mytilinidion resinicola]|uniref:DUF1275 domain protein n=1 Tax=Mytilinidion resinicola TaxID=574789 RepID=A0A6A6YYQ1_9PEZI|nr:uncharacterized protein BDZ99DRAFT_460806 [Mytilinidion resinicola]KAF2813629.1 hypothetical protein BDZ99DRAFT_460806 [Mytilinidion resinicola]